MVVAAIATNIAGHGVLARRFVRVCRGLIALGPEPRAICGATPDNHVFVAGHLDARRHRGDHHGATATAERRGLDAASRVARGRAGDCPPLHPRCGRARTRRLEARRHQSARLRARALVPADAGARPGGGRGPARGRSGLRRPSGRRPTRGVRGLCPPRSHPARPCRRGHADCRHRALRPRRGPVRRRVPHPRRSDDHPPRPACRCPGRRTASSPRGPAVRARPRGRDPWRPPARGTLVPRGADLGARRRRARARSVGCWSPARQARTHWASLRPAASPGSAGCAIRPDPRHRAASCGSSSE